MPPLKIYVNEEALSVLSPNNYEGETFFVYIPEFDQFGDQESTEQFIYFRPRFMHRGQRYPLWCNKPEECLTRGMIPTDLLKPKDIQSEIDSWIKSATDLKKPTDPEKFEEFFNWKKQISDRINELRSVIRNYNLPYLSLPSATPKDVALDVFINMNTNSKPLSAYDIIVAEIESVKGKSLHELQHELDIKHPDIKYYFDLSYLILNSSALLQEKLPNQKGLWDMDKAIMVDNWSTMEFGLAEMSTFLYTEGVIDRDRLPTNAVLAVIAALYPYVSKHGDERGVHELILRKYLWSAFFTDRYENSAATNAYYDYIALKRIFTRSIKDDGTHWSEKDVPILNRNNYPLADAEELILAGWPKRETIRGKAILSVACKLGSRDFATNQIVARNNIEERHYHHIFPDALLQEAGIEGSIALNCALILDNTNLVIGRKDPLVYLKDRYKWISQDVVDERLFSHLIPVAELANGGYEGLSDQERLQKISKDFKLFIQRRASLFAKAVEQLADGKAVSSFELMR